MKRFKSIVLAALALFVVAAYIPSGSASAQSASSASLSIAPKKDYIIDPGETIEDTLSIRNIDSSSDLQLYLKVIDFTYTDETGTPKLMLDQSKDPTTWSLRPYMKVPEEVTVRAGGSASVDIDVAIPSNLGAGSYYSAIIYSTGAPDGGNVGLSASGVTLVFVTVPGDVNEDLKITKLGAYMPNLSGPGKYMYFATDQPKVIAYTLQNNGNVAEAPVGSIKVRSMFGQEYTIEDINPNGSVALLGQTRTFEACIKLQPEEVKFQEGTTQANTCADPGLWPGLYTASIEAFYGQNGNLTKEINKTAYFWYLPLWFIVVFILVLLILAFYIWRSIVWMRGGSFKLGGRPRTTKRRQRRH